MTCSRDLIKEPAMLDIIICDDNENELNEAAYHLDMYFADHHNDVRYSVDRFIDPGSLRENLSAGHIEKCGIALLDICMPDILGTEIAADIRKRMPDTQIIFLTTSDEYAVDAFALHAAHYLIKPYTEEQFTEAMDRALAGYYAAKAPGLTQDGAPDLPDLSGTAPGQTLTIQNTLLPICSIGGSIGSIDINDILFIESHGHTLTLHCICQELTETRKTLAGMIDELNVRAPGQFVSPYKGYIVNQKAIRTIENDRIILRDDSYVPLPRRGISKIKDAYFDFMFGEGSTENDSI